METTDATNNQSENDSGKIDLHGFLLNNPFQSTIEVVKFLENEKMREGANVENIEKLKITVVREEAAQIGWNYKFDTDFERNERKKLIDHYPDLSETWDKAVVKGHELRVADDIKIDKKIYDVVSGLKDIQEGCRDRGEHAMDELIDEKITSLNQYSINNMPPVKVVFSMNTFLARTKQVEERQFSIVEYEIEDGIPF